MTAIPPAALPEPPEFPSPSIVDSRRLMGPNLYSAKVGVVLEVAFDASRGDALLDAWSAQASVLAGALGWGDAEFQIRRERNGASLFLGAPADVLMTATEVNEQAWVAAEATVQGTAAEIPVGRLRTTAHAERATRPNLLPGSPAVVEFPPMEFVVQRGEPASKTFSGYAAAVEKFFPLIDRIEVEFTYK